MSRTQPYEFEKRFHYFRFHVPTGELSFASTWGWSQPDFIAKMELWNLQQPDVWLYGPVVEGHSTIKRKPEGYDYKG